MFRLHWQKSTYCGDASNCLHVAATPAEIHLRESDTPHTVLTTTRTPLRSLIQALKAAGRPPGS
ncbi:DUF397 domain-containing protein [Streptomyces capitiformicae]|uniref:DUF397 domain-containing protein n=1 Tax=Streptomyces capitiformicae TaxID=2014920 RepID=A0A918ZGN3_9ACTN|nr:DUF397 domain-containing protein [Streptomyces capitiformicae]GHE51877.1 hypothetical protein GCM10017771_74050 [Streptomyces capitiformicae]